MSLFDTLDGTFMNFAYQWAFSNPVRKVYYNLTITGLSVAVALLIGTIELVGVLHDKLGLTTRSPTGSPGSTWTTSAIIIVGPVRGGLGGGAGVLAARAGRAALGRAGPRRRTAEAAAGGQPEA